MWSQEKLQEFYMADKCQAVLFTYTLCLVITE